MSNILLILAIFITVWTGVLILLKLVRGKTIEGMNIFLFAVSTASLIARYLNLW